MHIHILGICGTFMGSLALLAKQMGYEVSGADVAFYPPMSDLLALENITLIEGYEPSAYLKKADCIVVGNTMKRTNPAIEYMLNHDLRFYSGPQWLSEHVLRGRWVMAVAGTHGKTTTTSMLAWILHHAGLEPGFLIGGAPQNFERSSNLGNSPFFVIEADEYDTAFFDKRSKFLHYRPRTLILNNLEYDHADIFPNLDAIKTQFHHLIRTVPSEGLIIRADDDVNLTDVLEKGCWTPVETFALQDSNWSATEIAADGSHFNVCYENDIVGEVDWCLLGIHNVRNALASIAASKHAGVNPEDAIAALNDFSGVRRRLEVKGYVNGITVYDDFAHHPTAIETTLEGLRKHVGDARIIAVIDFASNSMRQGAHNDLMPQAFNSANAALLSLPSTATNEAWLENISIPYQTFSSIEAIIETLSKTVKEGDHVVMMSNKDFGNIHERFINHIKNKTSAFI